MKITQLLSVSFLLLFVSVKGFSQENNCNVKQLQVNAYDFVLKNLDSIKKYSAVKDKVTAELEFTEKGALTKSVYYILYGDKGQKEVKIWKGLEKYIKNTFSLCPESHLYNGQDQVLSTVFEIPFTKEAVAKAKQDIEIVPGYVAFGTGKTEIPFDSNYTLDVKSFKVGKKIVEPLVKEGTMDYDRSKAIKMTEVFYIAFDVVKSGKLNYLKYTIYQNVDHIGRIVTSENWRPIINKKVNLSVKGIRDAYPGVRHITPGEAFEFDIDITFK